MSIRGSSGISRSRLRPMGNIEGNLVAIGQVRKIHMIAICGTGMGSLAGLLKLKGFEVTGSDTSIYPPMSDQLASLKINVLNGYTSKNLEKTRPDLVIVGNAVSKTNEEVLALQNLGLPRLSMPEAVEKIFLSDRFSIVVAGTHGKTTSSALLAWLLERTGQSPSFLVGGILKNFSSSYQLGSGDYFVIEGDEYDSAFFDKKPKFLHYRPRMLILNPVEYDHADIYKNLDEVMQAFSGLISLMPKEGLVLACSDSPNVKKLIAQAPCRVVTFGSKGAANLKAENIRFGEQTLFEVIQNGKALGTLASPLLGRHNVDNLLGVTGILLELGIPLKEINTALLEFQGVKRRQEVLATIRGITLIDDFAHHPTAVLETLKALRHRYPEGRLWAIFEPRSNTTRRKVLQKDFITAFEPADEIIFAAPYLPEKIPEEERLDPLQVIEDLKKHGKKARYFSSDSHIDDIVDTVTREANAKDVLCFMSNGGFGGIYEKMMTQLKIKP